MAHINPIQVLPTMTNKTPMPEYLRDHLRGAGCQACHLGIRHAAEVSTGLPLYLRDAILDYYGAIVWCDCEMGKGRQAAAQRTQMDIRSADTSNGIQGEYIAAFVAYEIEVQLNVGPTVHAEAEVRTEEEIRTAVATTFVPDPEEEEDRTPSYPIGDWWAE